MPVDMKHQYKAVESVALSEITVCYLQKRCVPATEPPADSADLPVPIHEHCTTTSSAIGNESVPTQLAQRWFPGLAICNAKI